MARVVTVRLGVNSSRANAGDALPSAVACFLSKPELISTRCPGVIAAEQGSSCGNCGLPASKIQCGVTAVAPLKSGIILFLLYQKGICLPTESLALFVVRSRVPWYSVAAGALLPRRASAGGLEGPCRYIPRLRPWPRAFPAAPATSLGVRPAQRGNSCGPREWRVPPDGAPDSRGAFAQTYPGDGSASGQSPLAPSWGAQAA